MEIQAEDLPQTAGRRRSGAPARLSSRLGARVERRPWWSWVGLGAVAVLAFALFLWGLSRNGMANDYYAAAVKSGSISWKAWFFGAIDPGSFITVDKLPGALWVEGLFARIFGFSSWTMLVPEALAGVGSVLILYKLVRKWQGDAAGLLAALALAITPVAVAMFRFNNPDALLTFLLLAAAWALWSALEKGSTWKLATCGALIGFAFLTKMLEALVIVPAFVLVYVVCGPRRFLRRLWQIAVAGVALLVSGGWYIAVVALWPAASRPYIGGSGDNSILGLVFSRSAGCLGGGGFNPDFGGSPGWLRIFNAQLGGQAAWLVILALTGLLAGLWLTRKGRRTDLRRAGYLLWGGWTVLFLGVFSFASGVLHPYYTVVLAPGLAALAGGGSVTMWRLGRQHLAYAWLLPAAVLGTALLSAALLGRTPSFAPGLGTAIIVMGAAAMALLALVLARVFDRRIVQFAAGAIAVLCVLAGPVAYSLVTVSHSVTGPLAAAGPASSGFGPGGLGPGGPGPAGPGPPSLPGFGTASDSSAAEQTGLVEYLLANQSSAQYLVAVNGSQAAVPLILATGRPVMTMGGFNGQDEVPTLAQFQELVSAKKVRYILLGSTMGPGGMPGPPGFAGPGRMGGGSVATILQWVQANATAVDSSEYGGASGAGTLYILW